MIPASFSGCECFPPVSCFPAGFVGEAKQRFPRRRLNWLDTVLSCPALLHFRILALSFTTIQDIKHHFKNEMMWKNGAGVGSLIILNPVLSWEFLHAARRCPNACSWRRR